MKSKQALLEALQGATGWLVGRESVSEEILIQLPQLKVLAKYGVGLDNVDIEACERLQVTLGWEAGVNRDAVAEHTLGLILGLCRRISRNSHYLSQGRWVKDGGTNLTGRNVAIIGLGHIGKRVAEILQPFRCSLAYHDIVDQEAWVKNSGLNLKYMDWPTILTWADIISFHVPLTPETYHMLDINGLEQTRPGVYIINTSRGPVIDQEALKHCLKVGRIAGAGLDVFENEPLEDKELYSLENVVLTPHTAGNSQEAVREMGEASIRALQKVLG